MCRLLGVVSKQRSTVAELLRDELRPFVNLARDHRDGWGVAYVNALDEVVSAKEPLSPEANSRFDALATTLATDAALLHLRMASPGSPVELGNTHPFGDGTNAFAHNGAFGPSSVLDGYLDPAQRENLEGTTDSELYYRAIRQQIAKGEDPAVAIAHAAELVRTKADWYASLNCLLLTSEALFAYVDYNPRSEVLARRGPTFFDLHYLVEKGRVLVGSTGWRQSGWTRLEERHVLRIDRRDLRISISAP